MYVATTTGGQLFQKIACKIAPIEQKYANNNTGSWVYIQTAEIRILQGDNELKVEGG